MHRGTIQFPLALLAYGKDHYARLETALCHALVKTGQHRQEALSVGLVKSELADIKLPNGNDRISDEQIKILALGSKFCGVRTPESAENALSRWCLHLRAEKFLRSWRAAGLTTAWTRVPLDMIIEARDGTRATYRRFTALCAINAAIGSKAYAVVTRSRIRAGMIGFTSSNVLFTRDGRLTEAGNNLLIKFDVQVQIATISQTRTHLDNLVQSGLLSRFTPIGRGKITYYSKKLEPEQIAELLIKKAKRQVISPKLKQMAQQLQNVNNGLPSLSGEPSEISPLNAESPLNDEIATPPPAMVHPVATPSPLNAAFNASLNATENASVHADLNVSQILIKELPMPTLKEVHAFAISLLPKHTEITDSATAWFEANGKDEKWKVGPWKKAFARWALNGLNKIKAQQRQQQAAIGEK